MPFVPASIFYTVEADSADANVTELDADLSAEGVRPGDCLLYILGTDSSETHVAPKYQGGEKTTQDAGFSSVFSDNSGSVTASVWKKVGADAFDATGQVYRGSWSTIEQAVAAVFGIRGDNDIDVIGTASVGTGTGPVTPEIETTVGDCLVVWVLIGDDSNPGTMTLTDPASTTSVVDNLRSSAGSAGGVVMSIVTTAQASAGSTGTKTWAMSSARDYTTFAFALKPGEILADYIGGTGGRVVTIDADHTQVAGTGGQLTGFPLVITHDALPDEMLDSDDADLSDSGTFRVTTDAEGLERIPILVSSHTPASDPASAVSELWIWNPGINQETTSTRLYLWYGISGKTQPAASGRYGSASVAPWDFGMFSPNGGRSDRSPHQHTATVTGATSSTDVPFGAESTEFSGTNQDITFADANSLDVSDQGSFSVWFKPDVLTSIRTLFAKREGTPNNWQFFLNAASGNAAIIGNDGTLWTATTPITNFTTGVWQMVSGTIRQSGSDIVWAIYKNGSLLASGTTASHTITPGTQRLSIGSRRTTTTIDEDYDGKQKGWFYVPGIEFSADQVATFYNNQSDPASFWAVGTPANADGSGGGTDFALLPLAIDVSVFMDTAALAAIVKLAGPDIASATAMDAASIAVASVFLISPPDVASATAMESAALSVLASLAPGEVLVSTTMETAALAALVGIAPSDISSATTVEAVVISYAAVVVALYPFVVSAETRVFTVGNESRVFAARLEDRVFSVNRSTDR